MSASPEGSSEEEEEPREGSSGEGSSGERSSGERTSVERSSGERVPSSRAIIRPQMRPAPEDAPNPFILPAKSAIFTFRQHDIQEQKEKRTKQLSIPIYKRRYHQPRITARLPPTPEPEDPQVAQDDAFFRKNLAFTRVAMQNKGIERQTLAEFVQNKKDMFFLQYTINVKREQMDKLERIVNEEQERLDRDKAKIEKDYQVFDEFLKENDQMAVEAIRQAEEESRVTMDKVGQIRNINIQIMATKSSITKLEERYKELRLYRRFLYNLAPQEWRHERELEVHRLFISQQVAQQLETADDASSGPATASSKLTIGRPKKRGPSRIGVRRSRLGGFQSRVGGSRSRLGLGFTPLGADTSRLALSPRPSKRLSGAASPSRHAPYSAVSDRHSLGLALSAAPSRGSSVTLETELSTTRRMSALALETLQDEELCPDSKLYFTEPAQLFAVFLELEEQNLKLIQNSQETEEALEEMKTSGEITKERISREFSILQQQVHLLEQAAMWEEEKSEQLELFCTIFSQGEFKAEEQESALAELNEQVNRVYTAVIGENRANISTLQMLASLEAHIEDLFEYMETVPADRLHAAEKLRDRERRLMLREMKMQQQAEAQADRLRRARLRAMAEVKTHKGRKLVFRSRPPTPQRLYRKTAREEEQELEEYNYYFGGDCGCGCVV